MNYKKVTQELFEALLGEYASNNIDDYYFLCRKYPKQFKKYERRIQKELQEIQLPEYIKNRKLDTNTLIMKITSDDT